MTKKKMKMKMKNILVKAMKVTTIRATIIINCLRQSASRKMIHTLTHNISKNISMIIFYRNSTTSRKLLAASLNQQEQSINLSVVFIILHNRHHQPIILLNRCRFSNKELTSRRKLAATTPLTYIFLQTIKVDHLRLHSAPLNPLKAS